MTGLLGGGHGIHFDAASGRAANLDCFVAVPGLGREGEPVALLELEVPFGAELVHYAVGIGSCGVPGVPAGLDALWRARPASLAAARRAGSPARPRRRADAGRARRLPRDARAGDDDERGRGDVLARRDLLGAGDLLRQPGLVAALEALAEEGARASTRARSPSAARARRRARRPVTERTSRPTRLTGPSRSRSSSAATASGRGQVCPTSRERSRGSPSSTASPSRTRPRARGRAARRVACAARHDEHLRPRRRRQRLRPHDEPRPRLGRLPAGFDLHLNSMLGEADLLTGPLEPGERMESMMAPTITLGADGVALAVGAAGGTRLRTALVRSSPASSTRASSPRPPSTARASTPSARSSTSSRASAQTTGALESAGFEVRVWPDRHHYFGGVSAITPDGAAGDPRRNGESRSCEARSEHPAHVPAFGATGVRGHGSAARRFRIEGSAGETRHCLHPIHAGLFAPLLLAHADRSRGVRNPALSCPAQTGALAFRVASTSSRSARSAPARCRTPARRAAAARARRRAAGRRGRPRSRAGTPRPGARRRRSAGSSRSRRRRGARRRRPRRSRSRHEELRPDVEVRRREAERAAACVARDDNSLDLDRPAEQPRGPFDVALATSSRIGSTTRRRDRTGPRLEAEPARGARGRPPRPGRTGSPRPRHNLARRSGAALPRRTPRARAGRGRA